MPVPRLPDGHFPFNTVTAVAEELMVSYTVVDRAMADMTVHQPADYMAAVSMHYEQVSPAVERMIQTIHDEVEGGED